MSELTKFIEKGAAIAKGKREILRGIHDGEIAFVSIAKDADYSFRSEISLVCSMKKIPTESAMTMAELSSICSIAVPCGALGIRKVKEEKTAAKSEKSKETSKEEKTSAKSEKSKETSKEEKTSAKNEKSKETSKDKEDGKTKR